MSDYNFLMESRLSPEQFWVVNHLSRIAAGQGLNLYLVGGAVRDLTYGHPMLRDLDFAVEGNTQRILRHLETRGSAKGSPSVRGTRAGEPAPLEVERLQFDARRNSAELTFTHGVRSEIAMTRTEIYSKPGRRPEMSNATIFEDLKRRDFSVNAMAVSLHPNSRGLLLDPTNGVADIERRELRALYSRSFLDDPSRIYRLLRLSLRLGFKPEERTEYWLELALQNRVWESMEPEQQGRELRAILQEENSGRILKLMAQRRMLAGLDRKVGSSRIAYDRFEKIRSVVRSVPGADPFLLNFHSLVERLPSGQKTRLASKIIGDAKVIKLAFSLDREARKLSRALKGSKAALPSQVYHLLSGKPLPLLLFLLAHYPQAKIRNRVKSFLLKYPQIRAQLPRAELQAMGMEPGAKFEKVLEQVFLDQLDGKIRTHQQVSRALRELSGIKPPKPSVARAAAHEAKRRKLARQKSPVVRRPSSAVRSS